MLLYNEPIPLIKVNKTLNSTRIYTHIRSQTKNQLKQIKEKRIISNNKESLSYLKQKKNPKLTINTNHSIYIRKKLNFSKQKCSTNHSPNITSLRTETLVTHENNENNENNENIYNKTLSNLTHVKLQSQNILTQRNDNDNKKENKIIENQNESKLEHKDKKFLSRYNNYKNNIERTRSGKKK